MIGKCSYCKLKKLKQNTLIKWEYGFSLYFPKKFKSSRFKHFFMFLRTIKPKKFLGSYIKKCLYQPD